MREIVLQLQFEYFSNERRAKRRKNFFFAKFELFKKLFEIVWGNKIQRY